MTLLGGIEDFLGPSGGLGRSHERASDFRAAANWVTQGAAATAGEDNGHGAVPGLIPGPIIRAPPLRFKTFWHAQPLY
jgi:hypothetical protein